LPIRRVISITLTYLSSQCKYLFPTNERRDSLESDIWVCSVYMSGVLLPFGSRANWSFQEYRVGYFVHPLAYERVGYERSVRRRKPTCSYTILLVYLPITQSGHQDSSFLSESSVPTE
jgi:hypothetical protein